MTEFPFWMSNSWTSDIIGILKFYPHTFITHWWWVVIVIALGVLLGPLYCAAITGDSLGEAFSVLKTKRLWANMFCWVLIAYSIYCFAPSFIEYHKWQTEKWFDFVDDCLEAHDYELLDSARVYRYPSIYSNNDTIK